MAYLTIPEVTQIHASSIGELMVMWRLDMTRCCYQCQNIVPWDVVAIRSAPNDAGVKKMKKIAPSFANVKDYVTRFVFHSNSF